LVADELANWESSKEIKDHEATEQVSLGYLLMVFYHQECFLVLIFHEEIEDKIEDENVEGDLI
jgi:hypothetical protein